MYLDRWYGVVLIIVKRRLRLTLGNIRIKMDILGNLNIRIKMDVLGNLNFLSNNWGTLEIFLLHILM